MCIETLKQFFMWCTIVNGALLIVSSLLCVALRQKISPMHRKMFGISEDCPHGDSQMSDGAMVDDYIIECALHYGQFDVRDGSVLEPPVEIPIQTYAVKVVDGDVWVRGLSY